MSSVREPLLLDGRLGPVTLDPSPWHAPASAEELDLLRSCAPPVLDIGCGPGRITVALGSMGIPALGIDAAPTAVSHATGRGALALCRSVFDPVPGEGRWGTALLLDGNVGIGGDPVALLERTAQLLRPHGEAIVEVGPPGGRSGRDVVRLVRDGAAAGPWFPWAWVHAGEIARLARAAGLQRCRTEPVGDRWFARLGAARPGER